MDAPWHFYPTMDGGKPSWTIDEVPLEWCFGNGVVIDMRDKAPGYLISAQDLENYFNEKQYTPKKGDICLLMSGAGEMYGTDQYLSHQCGVGREATLWLAEHGVRVVGTDAWSWDPPMPVVAKRFSENHDSSILWEGHRAGKDCLYVHMEKLTNLEKLPFTDFQVICLPIKVKKASAGWVRAVALVND
jgi:kynurenine formamidase